MKQDKTPENKNQKKVRILRPAPMTEEQECLWDDVRKFAKLVPNEVEPNMGRVREIKEEIAKGNYVTPQVIEETAARLTIRFTKKE